MPEEFVACHWHSDIFDLPTGAVALASSALTELQGFRYGENAWGLLFHAEMTQRIVAALVSEFGEGLKRVGINGDEILASAPQHLAGLGKIWRTDLWPLGRADSGNLIRREPDSLACTAYTRDGENARLVHH